PERTPKVVSLVQHNLCTFEMTAIRKINQGPFARRCMNPYPSEHINMQPESSSNE
ncbi:hypothetical protein C0995_015726, partial [Termitomyces sp. Mi166